MFGGNFHIYYRWMPQQDQLLILHQLHWGYSQQSLRQKAAEHRGRVKVWHTLPAKQSDHRVNLVYNGLSSCQHHPSITRSCSSNPDLRSSHAVLCSKKDNALQALWSLLPTRDLQSEPKWHEIPSTTPDGRKAVFGQQISLISQRHFSEQHWKSGAALTQSPTRLTVFSRWSFPQDFPEHVTSLPAKFQWNSTILSFQKLRTISLEKSSMFL